MNPESLRVPKVGTMDIFRLPAKLGKRGHVVRLQAFHLVRITARIPPFVSMLDGRLVLGEAPCASVLAQE